MKYTEEDGDLRELISSGGKVHETGGRFYLSTAMSGETDYLSGKVSTESVRVNNFTNKIGDGASQLAALIEELNQMIMEHIDGILKK